MGERVKPINYYRRLFQTSYQLLKVRAVNLGWLLLLALLMTLHILMLNPGLVAIKVILIIGFLSGLIFELNLILTAFTTNKTILNKTDLLMLTSWRRLSKRWLQLGGISDFISCFMAALLVMRVYSTSTEPSDVTLSGLTSSSCNDG